MRARASQALRMVKRAVARIPRLGPFLQRSYWDHLNQKQRTATPLPLAGLTLDPEFVAPLAAGLNPLAPPPDSSRSFLAPEAPPPFPAEEICVVSGCTTNYLPFARTLLESIRSRHGDVPFVLAVVDAPSRTFVSFEGAIILCGRDLFGPDLDFLALKFNASELCCAAKPHVIEYVLTHARASKVVYLDCDIYLFAPLDVMLQRLENADFVVTPHTIAPMPRPDRFWERPSLGDIALAGVLNAGMFALRRGQPASRFLANWKRMVTAPGAFVGHQGGQTEQNAFNWLPCFEDSVSILRDPAYNVAYWNLHDRSLRYLDTSEDGPRWTVEGQPLVAFHFSGFSIDDRTRLSRWDYRYALHAVPATARLADFYRARLTENDRGEFEWTYRYAAFPSGIGIDDRMRDTIRLHEGFLRGDLSPWTPEGESHYCRALLSPVPYTRSLVPVLIQTIIQQRPDLPHGDTRLDPTASIEWFRHHGIHEYQLEALFDRHRPAVLSHHGAVTLTAIHRKWPRLFENLDAPLRSDRSVFITRLQSVTAGAARQILEGPGEYWTLTEIGLIRAFLRERPDLLEAFPDLLFDDARRFAVWLRTQQGTSHFLQSQAIDTFEAKAEGRALARIYSLLARAERWAESEQFPLALVGEDSAGLALSLLGPLRHSVEYDVDDVMMFLWIMQSKPWAGLALTLELPLHVTRHPSSRSREGQDEILAPILQRDRRFAVALEAHRSRIPPVKDRAPRSIRTSREISVYSLLEESSPPRRVAKARSVPPGINLFGYHKSEIGLGRVSRGLATAFETTGVRVTRPLLTNVKMDTDLEPGDFTPKYDASLGTNVFISYPHMRERILETIPDEVRLNHRNVAYLAWEQRGGTHYWKDVYAEFDDIWALSEFAAQSLSAVLQRPVHAVPCVVDTSLFPGALTKEEAGLDPSETTFLFVFDANSSMFRKNPEAVVAAFKKAFHADDPVRLIIKATNAASLDHRAALRDLMATITHPGIELRTTHVSAAELYGLISASDCYLSLHRSEGFGYTCAEAMAYGKPVIATGYSGNLQFMNDQNAYLVNFEEVESPVGDGPFPRGGLWAEVDIDHAAELMRQVVENPAAARCKGARARGTIQRDLSPTAIGAHVRRLLAREENRS